MSVMRLTVPTTIQKLPLYYWLVRRFRDFSVSLVQRLIKKGAITINGEISLDQEYELAGGEIVEIDWSKHSTTEPAPPEIELDILYEDHHVVVVNKPARLVVHPSTGHANRTVINALVNRYPNIEPYTRGWPRIVHRLDRDTSGVLIVARSLYAVRYLQEQFRERTTEKEYLALVLGHPEPATGTVEAPIARHKSHWRKWAVVPDGRPSTTHYRTLESFANTSLLLARPITGRTHQIRVHLDSIGLPIAGDEVYGPRYAYIPHLTRHFLHAARLTITTPDRQRRTFYAPLPEGLQAVLWELRAQSESESESESVCSPSEVAERHHIPWFPWVVDPTLETPPWEVDKIQNKPACSPEVKPAEKKISLIELLAPLEEIEGFEAIELSEGFEGSEEFFDQFEDFEEFLQGFEGFEDEEFEDEEYEDEEYEDESVISH